ncbi:MULTISPECIES: hypothetical protein [Caballeronia]|jgi:hypothetical protein|nr:MULTISPECIES: hypothetical protein [Caballeronia]MDR5767134.1 hypothetical protein [Caballeronia sp. LZ028]MDR5791221.1 hypothetical protein [Caballeronia sp. LP003]MDR5795654.1 hypothetical protein [Caballeronia sp. LZ008]
MGIIAATPIALVSFIVAAVRNALSARAKVSALMAEAYRRT